MVVKIFTNMGSWLKGSAVAMPELSPSPLENVRALFLASVKENNQALL